MSALSDAAKNGNLATVKKLLTKENVNEQDGGGATALHHASFAGHKEVVEFLLEKGADVRIKENYGFIPLDVAVLGNRPEIVELLIKKGSDVNNMANAGTSPLHSAAYMGEPNIAKILIKLKADVNARMAQSGATPLHVCALKHNTEFAEVLLKSGADVNSATTGVWDTGEEDQEVYPPATALHIAAQFVDPAMASLLVKFGAKTDLKERDGSTALHIAIIADPQAKVVEVLLNAKAPTEAKDRDGWTPLHNAARHNRVKSVELLLKSGADKNAKTAAEYRGVPAGATPKDLAAKFDHKEIVALLN